MQGAGPLICALNGEQIRLRGTAARKQMNHKQDKCNYEQQVNQPADNMENEEGSDPHEEKHNRDRKQEVAHEAMLSRFGGSLGESWSISRLSGRSTN